MAIAALQGASPATLDDAMKMVKAQQQAESASTIDTPDQREYNQSVREGNTGGIKDWLKSKHQAALPAAIQLNNQYQQLMSEGRAAEAEQLLRFSKSYSPQQLETNAYSSKGGELNAVIEKGGKAEQTQAYGKDQGATQSKDFTNLQAAPTATRDLLNNFKAMHEALGQTQGGSFGELSLDIKKKLQALGLPVDDASIASGEFAKALGNQVALQLRSPANGAGMPGAMSDKDREFLVSMVPGLSTTPKGREQLIEHFGRVLDRQQEVARLAADYVKKNGALDYGFAQSPDIKKLNETPLFPEKDAGSQGNNSQGAAPQGSQGQSQATPGVLEKGPQVGENRGGYIYLGGDTNSASSWRAK
jgi:hypothetical protein